MSEMNISAIVETFVGQITAAVEATTVERIQAALSSAFGVPQKRGPGRPSKQSVTTVSAAAPSSAPKKSRPKQLCPVPGCKNVAAPVFGMVCSDHKNVAKSKIKLYRAARKGKTGPVAASKTTSAKAVAKTVTKVAKAAKKASPKVARARKLQGQYLGAMRALTGDDRAKVKAVAKDKGVAEAVKLALSIKKAKA